MKRKLLSVFLSLAMVLTMMPVFAMADSNNVSSGAGGGAGGGTTGGELSSTQGVAEIGGQSYETLEKAISQAENNDTIKLLADVDIKSEIDFTGKTITLDLNGKKINANVPNNYSVIEAKGESASLTIKDTSGEANGKLISDNYGISAAEGGKLIIESGTIESNYAAMAGNNTAGDMNFEVNGGTLTSKLSEAIYMPGQVQLTVNAGEINGGISARMGQITVNGGTINGMTSNQSADKMEEYYNYSGSAWIGDAIYIWGGTYTSDNSLENKTNVKINGGIINGNAHRAIAIYDIGTNYTQDVTVKISGGTVVSGDVVIDKTYGPHTYKVDASIEIEGGTFSSDVTKYCAENYVTEKNNDNTYTVKHLKDVAVARIGENGFYRTIQDAVNAAENIATITLLKDTTTDMISIENGKSITLNTNGKTITNSNGNYAINNKGILTINGGGKIVRKDAGNSAIRTIGTLNLENITVETSNNKIAVKVDENGISNPYGILNVGEGTVLTAKDGQAIQSWGDVTINGGTMNGEVAAWSVKDWNPGKITINNATINGDVTAYQRLKDGKYPDKPATINIINGMIDGASQIKYVEYTNGTIIERNKTNDEVTGSINISGGYFTLAPNDDYLATYTGTENKQFKVENSYENRPYIYRVVLVDVDDVPVVSAVGETKAPTADDLKENESIDSNKVDDVVSAAKNVEAEKINVAASAVANKISDADADKYIEAATKETEEAAVTDPEKIEVRAYLHITPKAYKEGDGAVYTLEITPKYDIVVVGKGNSAAEKNEKVVDSGTLNVTNETNITVQLPAGFIDENDAMVLYVQHKGHEYDATVTKNTENNVDIYTASFKNPDGFSQFTISKTSQTVAQIGDKKYTSLQDAVDAAKDNAEITIVGGNKDYTATITGSSKTVKITNGFEKVADDSNNINVTVNGTPKTITPGSSETFTYKINSSSGSGSGSITATYTVTVGSVSNGTVTSSHKSAASGATVTLTVKPADGYAVEAVTAKDAKGNAVKVTEKDGKYTFAMPASDVTVSASFKKSEQPAEKLFDDVAQGVYYYDAVKWAVDKGVTNGKTSNLFGSDDPCTRAQIVTFLYRAAGSPAGSAAVSFTDVKDSDYYAKAVAWAVEKGITNGTGDGKFSPDDTCTRAQCAAFLYRAAGSPEVTGAAAFSDVAAGAYYAKAVAWAEKNGITNGLGNGKFGSDNSCTRAQIITFLYRTYQGK